jgi:hypothetical protein
MCIFFLAFTGYMQRRIAKSMEDMMTDSQGRVINSSGHVIQMLYGGDGFHPSFLERDNLRMFPADGSDWSCLYRNDYVPNDEMVYLETMRTKVLDALCRDRNRDRFNLVFTPVHLTRAMMRIAANSASGILVDPLALQQWRIETMKKVMPFCGNNMKLQLYFNDHLSTKSLMDWCATEDKLKQLSDHITNKVSAAFIPSGELVGQAAAQSIGEPLTQVSSALFFCFALFLFLIKCFFL